VLDFFAMFRGAKDCLRDPALFTREDSPHALPPFAKTSAAHVAWSDFHSRIVADAFHFPETPIVYTYSFASSIETRRRIRRKHTASSHPRRFS